MLLGNSWETTTICIDTKLIIILVLVKLIPISYQKLLQPNKIIDIPLNRSDRFKYTIIPYPDLLINRSKNLQLYLISSLVAILDLIWQIYKDYW